MIRIKRKEGIIYFKLTIWYWLGWFKYEVITQEFSADEYTLKEVKNIRTAIISEMNRRFK